MEEPHFLVNEFLLEDIDELKKITKAVKSSSSEFDNKSLFLRDFTHCLFKAYNTKETTGKIMLKAELEQKKKEIVKKIELIKKQTGSLTKQSLPRPKIILKKDLIFSKVTKRPLTSVSFDGVIYNIKEPMLDDREKNLLKILEKKVSKEILKDSEIIKNLMIQEGKKLSVNGADEMFDKLRYYIIRDKVRFGKVSVLIEDQKITEVTCEGVNKPVRILYENRELPTNIIFNTKEELNNFVEHLAMLSGNLVSVENPFLYVSFEGFDIQATLETEFVSGKFVLIRK